MAEPLDPDPLAALAQLHELADTMTTKLAELTLQADMVLSRTRGLAARVERLEQQLADYPDIDHLQAELPADPAGEIEPTSPDSPHGE